MTTYNTGNPIGSTDARDLYDNAQALDNAVNSSSDNYTNRFGSTRKTLRWFDNQAPRVEASVNSAQAQANAASATSLALAGITATFATYAEMNSAIGSIAANQFVGVLVDENKTGQSSIYRKESGVMVYRGELGAQKKWQNGFAVGASYNRGSVICHIGDSNTQARPGYRTAYTNDWLGKGGIFESWTSYNHGANGQTAVGYASGIASGDQNAQPYDYPAVSSGTSNPWQTVNADPSVIIYSLGTNDFRVNAGTANLATVTANARAAIASLVNFFLARTRALIVLRMPPPIVYANPDPNGWTDCTSAADAAARSAAIRSLYLEWMNVSDRVVVVDLHKHLFGYRIDSLASATDPEGQGALMADTLHPSDLGFQRTIQIIAKTLDPSLPYTSNVLGVPTTISDAMYWSATFKVNAAGNAYIDISKDPLAIIGSRDRGAVSRGSLKNIPLAEALLAADAVSKMRQLLSLPGGFTMYAPADGTTATVSKINSLDNRTLNGEWRLLLTGDYSAFAGKIVTFYATSPKQIPQFAQETTPITIPLNGPQPLTTGAVGVVNGIFNTGTLTPNGVSGFRESGSGTAQIDLFITNQVEGRYVDGAGTFNWPGKRLGTMDFSSGCRTNSSFTVDSANFPSGSFSIAYGGYLSINAKVISGSIGVSGSITITPI